MMSLVSCGHLLTGCQPTSNTLSTMAQEGHPRDAASVPQASCPCCEQLGQLRPLVEDSDLLALLLLKLSRQDRLRMAMVCRKMCHKVCADASQFAAVDCGLPHAL